MLSTENKQATLNTTALDDGFDFDNDPTALAAYYKEMFAATRTHSDELHELNDSGNREAFEDRLRTLAQELAGNDDEFKDNIEKLKSLRQNSRPDKSETRPIVDRQREIIDIYKKTIIAECGLPDEARFSELENAKQNVQTILTETYGDTPYTRDEALATLGIITVNDDDSMEYHFPEQLVPASVQEKWETYLASVCAHVETVDNLKVTGDKDAVMRADTTRRYAHNSVALDFKDIFGLGLDKEVSRDLLAKMRDRLFPNHTSITTPSVKAFIGAHSHDLTVAAYLSGMYH